MFFDIKVRDSQIIFETKHFDIGIPGQAVTAMGEKDKARII